VGRRLRLLVGLLEGFRLGFRVDSVSLFVVHSRGERFSTQHFFKIISINKYYIYQRPSYLCTLVQS
jgi:hypothetical protein